MSVKTLTLFSVAFVLAYMVYLDYSGGETESTVTVDDVGSVEKLQKLARIVNAEREINAEYGELSMPYAQRMALLSTFVVDHGDAAAQLATIIRQLSEQYNVKVEQLNIGSPQLLSDGIFWLQADIEMSSLSSNGIWSVFLNLADHQHGFEWKSFKLRALTDEKKVLLSGQLVAVLIQAVE